MHGTTAMVYKLEKEKKERLRGQRVRRKSERKGEKGRERERKGEKGRGIEGWGEREREGLREICKLTTRVDKILYIF